MVALNGERATGNGDIHFMDGYEAETWAEEGS
jgi:hypothetical protein